MFFSSTVTTQSFFIGSVSFYGFSVLPRVTNFYHVLLKLLTDHIQNQSSVRQREGFKGEKIIFVFSRNENNRCQHSLMSLGWGFFLVACLILNLTL